MLRMIFGTGHTTYHWGALLECGARVPLWFPERRFGRRKNDMLENLPYV